ncbi:MAG TPA: hypothetical protein VIR98_03310 [Candidatus Paceibacterota bacterium]|jgi:hypothetical protein
MPIRQKLLLTGTGLIILALLGGGIMWAYLKLKACHSDTIDCVPQSYGKPTALIGLLIVAGISLIVVAAKQ